MWGASGDRSSRRAPGGRFETSCARSHVCRDVSVYLAGPELLHLPPTVRGRDGRAGIAGSPDSPAAVRARPGRAEWFRLQNRSRATGHRSFHQGRIQRQLRPRCHAVHQQLRLDPARTGRRVVEVQPRGHGNRDRCASLRRGTGGG